MVLLAQALKSMRKCNRGPSVPDPLLQLVVRYSDGTDVVRLHALLALNDVEFDALVLFE